MQGHGLAQHEDADLLPVSITVSVVAVLLALVSLLGHRAHTRTIYVQNQAIGQWVYYESKAAGRTSYDALLDFLPIAALRDPASEAKLADKFHHKIEQSDQQQAEVGAKANALEHQVEQQEHAADRFDFGDVCLEAALVIISITLLTKQRLYWRMGLVLASLGVVVAVTGLFIA